MSGLYPQEVIDTAEKLRRIFFSPTGSITPVFVPPSATEAIQSGHVKDTTHASRGEGEIGQNVTKKGIFGVNWGNYLTLIFGDYVQELARSLKKDRFN
ncbi:hypothetical protein [Actibacterium pelagium]|uniref:hypothetical protein n=1 Tax=Actibacterium pelagium TaxID=2029103 RepID=UPI0011783196|nr:hypothetical protein [Actibacterium pelagium]